MPQTRLNRELEGGMAISVGRLREDTQYDYKFVCLSHNTLRGAAGGAVLMAELLCERDIWTDNIKAARLSVRAVSVFRRPAL